MTWPIKQLLEANGVFGYLIRLIANYQFHVAKELGNGVEDI